MSNQLKRNLFIFGLCVLPVFVSASASAQTRRVNKSNRGLQQFANNNVGEYDFEYQGGEDEAADAAREQQAEANFDAIMIPQNKGVFGAAKARQYRRPAPNVAQMPSMVNIPPASGPSVEIPLKEFLDVRKRLQVIHKEAARRQGPSVVLGTSSYSGEAIQGALRLKLDLQVTLGRPEEWKTVPLIGDDVVLVKATVANKTIPVSRQSGYHVWVTRHTGEVKVTIDLLVPARGPRGSIEYDFLVPRTPVTNFSCQFPVAGLEPRLDAAVQSDAKPKNGGTLLSATLRPTARIHIVGFRDLGEAEGQKAKIYAESLNLLSIDEGTLDIFAVFRYTILYSGTKEFNIQIPKGLDVVSADGMGAFRFNLVEDENGKVLKGETAFPIRKNYEISVRLHRETPKAGESFEVPLPRCLGVEREIGYLGIEVPGKLKLTEGKAINNITSIDVRQLPEEMVRSAVSPILRAYRYHTSDSKLTLITAQLPDREPASGSIDRIRAFTTVTQEGNVMTDMRITLRNRLRHSLTLAVPKDCEIRSALLDGSPVKPSRNEQGRLMLPLKRSAGGDSLKPFTVSVVMHTEVSSMGLFGSPDLLLPAVDLPVSSLAWSVYLPSRNLYTTMKGDIEPQVYSGRGSWHLPSTSYQSGQWDAPIEQTQQHVPTVGPVESAHTGAMPVRIKLPADGIRLDYSRYWIDKGIDDKNPANDRPTIVSFMYVRSWLKIPAWMGLALLLGFGILLISTRFSARPPRWLPWIGGLLAIIMLWPIFKLGGLIAIFIGILLGFIAIAFKRDWLRRIPSVVSEWAGSLRKRFHERKKDPRAWTAQWVVNKMFLTIGLIYVGLHVLNWGLHLLWLLLHPL
ncbi:MAG: hypothetical protein JRJ87_15805 [Deltaproteobacteria bacterium]|nr:hypothetical protein [Deltaproteobacteria bacterium]